jgi:hypothetical protein
VLAKEWQGEEVELQVTLNVTCFRVTFDEEAAGTLGWPSVWPGAAATALKPQLFVDEMPAQGGTVEPLDMAPVKKLVADWTGGKDPKSLKPVQLAKFLAGHVMEHVQISGNGMNTARTGELEGFNLQGAAETALHRRGSEFDAVCLLAAVYREAGLPCRTVIGYDVGEDKRDNKFLSKNNGTKGLRAWVEFALADPASPGGLAWVPVDIVRMRKNTSRAGPLDKPWPYFGTHEELDGVIPIAFQFHPPTTVVAHGSPALWGWLVTPKPPDRAQQTVRFSAVTASTTLDQQEKKRQEKDKEKEKKRGRY